MSPAHHQLHHSANPAHFTNPAHFNCNLGSCLAVWDWLFGTLIEPPKESPRLRFGVDEPRADPHAVKALMIEPIVGAVGALAPRGLSLLRFGTSRKASYIATQDDPEFFRVRRGRNHHPIFRQGRRRPRSPR